MTRPKKCEKQRRSRHIIFRLTEAEYDIHCARADKAGLSPNELARRLTRNGDKHLIVKTYRRFDPAFLGRIDKIGHNLNQIVKNAHIFGRLSPRVERICETIDQIIKEAMEEVLDDSEDR